LIRGDLYPLPRGYPLNKPRATPVSPEYPARAGHRVPAGLVKKKDFSEQGR